MHSKSLYLSEPELQAAMGADQVGVQWHVLRMLHVTTRLVVLSSYVRSLLLLPLLLLLLLYLSQELLAVYHWRLVVSVGGRGEEGRGWTVSLDEVVTRRRAGWQ